MGDRLMGEIERLRREVEFEANAIDPGAEGGYSRDNIRFPLCMCVPDELADAARLSVFSRPVCTVHPEPCPAHDVHPHQGMKCLDCKECTSGGVGGVV
jgi:hypothetical protein